MVRISFLSLTVLFAGLLQAADVISVDGSGVVTIEGSAPSAAAGSQIKMGGGDIRAGGNIKVGRTTQAAGDEVVRGDDPRLASSGGGGATSYILIEDVKAINVQGGTFTQGAWRTRDLNTEIVDTGNHATISGNVITLLPGTYRFHISAPAKEVDKHQARLYNITAGALVGLGTEETSPNNGTTSRSEVFGRITIAVTSGFEIQHQCSDTKTTNGFGSLCSWGDGVFTVAEFWRE